MFTDLSLVLEHSVVRISDQKESQNALKNIRRRPYGEDKEMRLIAVIFKRQRIFVRKPKWYISF